MQDSNHDQGLLYPPWSKGQNNPASFKGVDFTIPEVDTLVDLHGDPSDARLVIFMGGNYFFLMVPLVKAFLERRPELEGKLFYETLPPGILQSQIQQNGTITLGNFTLSVMPDVFQAGENRIRSMIDHGILEGPAHDFMRNKLTIMVPADNPAGIDCLDDFGTSGTIVAMPDPRIEGVAVLAKEALKRSGGPALVRVVYEEKVDSGETILTRIHHRQTPLWLMKGEAHGGITWATEALFQRSIHNPIASIEIPEKYNVRGVMSAARLRDARHPAEATAWLEFLSSATAAEIAARHGFEPIA